MLTRTLLERLEDLLVKCEKKTAEQITKELEEFQQWATSMLDDLLGPQRN